MNDNAQNLTASPPPSTESDGTYCTMHPYCEWGRSCKGIHSFSPKRSEETVEGSLEHVPNFSILKKNDNAPNINKSPPPSIESDGTYCSMHPYCEWGHRCKGIHSFSPQPSEETVEGSLEHVPNFDDGGDSGKPPLMSHDDCVLPSDPIEPLDDIIVPDSEDSQLLYFVLTLYASP